MRIIMKGHIHTETPLATCPPGTEDPKRKDSSIPREANMSGFPRMRVYSEELGDFVILPYMPASGIRGAFRRCARDELAEGLGEKWSLDLHRVLTAGGTQQKGHKVDFDLEEYIKRLKSDPFLGLFGGSRPHWVQGELTVGMGIPDVAGSFGPESILGVKTDSIDRNPEELYMLSDEERIKYTRIKELTSEKQSLQAELNPLQTKKKKGDGDENGTDEDRIKELQERLKTLNSELSGYLGGDPDKAQVNERQITGYQAIPAGVPLAHHFVLHNADDRQAGLFFSALDRFAKSPYLGARRAQGCGLVSGAWDVEIKDGGKSVVGECIMDPFSGIIIRESDLWAYAEKMMEAWREHVQSISVQDLEGLVA